MELRLYLRMLRNGWWLIVLTAIVATNAALIADYLATPMYQTSARFVVSPSPDTISSRDAVNSLATLDKRSIVSTYAEFLNSQRIYQDTLTALGLESANLRDYSHNAVVLPDANILELTVIGPDPALVTTLANSIGQRAIGEIQNVYQVYDIRFLDPAIEPRKPFSPNPTRDAALAMTLGIVSGGALAILKEQIQAPLETYRRRRIFDSLSGAFTRRHFEHRVQEKVERDPDGLFSLGLLQVTGMEDLIDNLPQPIVHRVMHQVTDVLRKELRGNDIIGRWNDTHFAVMLPATPGEGAARTLRRVHRVLSEPVELEPGGDVLQLEPHIGIVVYRNGDTLETLRARLENSVEQARRSPDNATYLLDTVF
ncbi:MAG: hypothetical protein Fur0018_26330 [Anaerolineales bacterium]